MKVAIYWNLHKKIFSIQSREKENYGKVIDHVVSAVIQSPKFVVRQAGREKVLKENSKNVHAFITGTLRWVSDDFFEFSEGRRITYNPYKYNSFVIADTKEQVSAGEYVTMTIQDLKPIMEVV